jgi:uncharacterized protein (DUF934 family)
MPLVKSGEVVEDRWTHVSEDAESMPTGDHLIVSLEQWTTHKVELCKRGGAFAVRLSPDQGPELVADDLQHFDLVALEFPAFTDGRAYSHARLLRERYGFKGEIRAVGDVLLEQLFFMHRAGFDAFEVDSKTPIQDWQTAFADIDVLYQPAADGQPTATQLRGQK